MHTDTFSFPQSERELDAVVCRRCCGHQRQPLRCDPRRLNGLGTQPTTGTVPWSRRASGVGSWFLPMRRPAVASVFSLLSCRANVSNDQRPRPSEGPREPNSNAVWPSGPLGGSAFVLTETMRPQWIFDIV